MSISRMVASKAIAAKGASTAVASPDKPVGVPTDILDQITTWIPTETIAIYVALLPLLAPASSSTSYTSRWVLFGLVTAANPVVALLASWAKTPKQRTYPWFAIAASTVAFAAWAFALPDTPLKSITGYSVVWNTAIVSVVTISIVLVANAFGKSPTFDQVQTVQQGANAGPQGAQPAGH